jgi:hypothetical protein
MEYEELRRTIHRHLERNESFLLTSYGESLLAKAAGAIDDLQSRLEKAERKEKEIRELIAGWDKKGHWAIPIRRIREILQENIDESK